MLFLVDGKSGVAPQDHEIAALLTQEQRARSSGGEQAGRPFGATEPARVLGARPGRTRRRSPPSTVWEWATCSTRW